MVSNFIGTVTNVMNKVRKIDIFHMCLSHFILQKKQQWQQLTSQLGLCNALLYVVNHFLSQASIKFAFNKYYFVSQLLRRPPLLPEGKEQRFAIMEWPAPDVNSHPCPRPMSILADRYSQGAICFAAFRDDEFAACLWYATSEYREVDEVRCSYHLSGRPLVWDFDVYVAPKFRLSSVFLKLWDEVSAKLVAQGYLYSLSRISAFNAVSLSSHRRMGAETIGWAVFVNIGMLQLTIASLKPFFHLSFTANSEPVFNFQSPKI